MEKRALAIDLGASSGRVIAGKIENDKIVFDEVYRFAEKNYSDESGVLRWDFEYIFSCILFGIRRAAEKYEITSIGIDTWGVDFGLVGNDGKLVADPMFYRDEHTLEAMERVHEIVGKDELYRLTGTQQMHFNTVYQIYFAAKVEREKWLRAKTLLLMPDLIAYRLTGKKRLERTIASTTGLLGTDGKICGEILRKLDIEDKFAPAIEPGEVYGTLTSEVAKFTGAGLVPVVAVCSHDTASAVAAVPSDSACPLYISSGTWSLLGTLLPRLKTDEAAQKYNFTNELGYGGSVRFLRNIMGLWILQQVKKNYEDKGENISFADMEKLALSSSAFGSRIDVNDPLFEPPGDMLARVDEYLRRTHQPLLSGDGAKIRCVYESLSDKYADTIAALESTIGVRFDTLYIVGGGIQARLLSRLTAQKTGKKVVCGPVEATAMGNLAVQFISQGLIEDEKQAKRIISRADDVYIEKEI